MSGILMPADDMKGGEKDYAKSQFLEIRGYETDDHIYCTDCWEEPEDYDGVHIIDETEANDNSVLILCDSCKKEL